MSQTTWVRDSGLSGTAFREANNSAGEAHATLHAGTSRPSYAVANMLWWDTSGSPTLSLKFYDGTDDITVMTVNTSTNVYTPVNAELVSGASSYYTTTGSANTYAITVSGITAYTDIIGRPFRLKINADSTGASTLNINSYGTKNILKDLTASIAAGDLLNGGIYWVCYDGTSFLLISPPNMTKFVTNQTAITTLENADQFLVADNSNSNNLRKITFENLIAALPTSSTTTYDSGDQTYAADGTLSLTHSLGGEPHGFVYLFKCKAGGDGGYTANDYVYFPSEGGSGTSRGMFGMKVTATQFLTKHPDSLPQVPNFSTGSQFDMASGWSLRILAWRFS